MNDKIEQYKSNLTAEEIDGALRKISENDISHFATTPQVDALSESVSGVSQRVDEVSSRVSGIIANGTSTEGNTELIDMRTGWKGERYPTAGDALRQQAEEAVQSAYASVFAAFITKPLRVNLTKLSAVMDGSNTVFANTHAFTVPDQVQLDFSGMEKKNTTIAIVYNEKYKSLHYRAFNFSSRPYDFELGDVVLAILYFKYDLESDSFSCLNKYAFPEKNVFFDNIEYIKNSEYIDESIESKTEQAAIPYRVMRATNVRVNIDTAAMTISVEKTASPSYLWYDAKRPMISLSDEPASTTYADFLNNSAFVQYGEDKKLELSKSTNTEAKGILCSIWFNRNGEIYQINCSDELKPIFYLNGSPFFGLSDVIPDYHPHGVWDVGCLDYQDIGETDYSQIILYGQSLSMGWQAPEVITTDPVRNTFMVGNSPMINHGNDGSLTINPLKAVKWASGGEQPVVAMTNAFAKIYHRFVNPHQKFIGTNCGEGGRSIERLMKQCTNGTNYYTTEFLDCINRTKSACDAAQSSVSCPAIVYMQGEYNYVSRTGAGLTTGTDATNDKEQYKAYLLQLKKDMQADIIATYGQTKPPLFFLYQVAGNYINNKEMTINMAQVEFAQENEDVILLNSTYGMPDYNGGHLSTNGYRWYGELVAKQMAQVLVKGVAARPVELEELQVESNRVTMCFYVPVPPLVFDTHTKEAVADNGFRLYCNGSEVAITGMEIRGNRVTLTAAKSLSGTVELTYGGEGRNGSGNLRDSDGCLSLYRYYDDRQTSPDQRESFTPTDIQGTPLYGRHYPLYNWCNQFYRKLEV